MFKKKSILMLVFSFIIFYGCCSLTDVNNDQNPSQPSGQDEENEQPYNPGEDYQNPDLGGGTSNGEEEQIPQGTLALFYVSGLGSSEYSTDVYDYYGNPINVESSSRAVVMYLPELSKTFAVKTYTSSSYSQNVVYPHTASGKFFVVRDWGSDWSTDNNDWDIEEFDAYTGELKTTTNIVADRFAIVEDTVYFVSGGILHSIEIGGNGYYAEELHSSSGIIYGVGNHLLSILYDYSGEYVTLSIREHNLQTGAITTILYDDIPTDPVEDDIFPGEEAIYQVQSEGFNRYIYRYPIVGEEESFTFTLLEDENDVYVAEEDGILAILVQSETSDKITGMLLHDLQTGEESWLDLEPFPASPSFTRIGVPFLVLE